jgi:hypothetical protein
MAAEFSCALEQAMRQVLVTFSGSEPNAPFAAQFIAWLGEGSVAHVVQALSLPEGRLDEEPTSCGAILLIRAVSIARLTHAGSAQLMFSERCSRDCRQLQCGFYSGLS